MFITGTDEHGEKIASAAAANGSTPKDHCDVVSQAYKNLWADVMFRFASWLEISVIFLSLGQVIAVEYSYSVLAIRVFTTVRHRLRQVHTDDRRQARSDSEGVLFAGSFQWRHLPS